MTERSSRGQGPTLRIVLDPRVPWEALIERRLEALAASRRSAWLRGILVAGFRETCWLERQLDAPNRSAWRTNRPVTTSPAQVVQATAQGCASRSDATAHKPFRGLAQVIGK